jgi:hypothetical protein
MKDHVLTFSPPFEGGVAETDDYLLVDKLFARPGWLIRFSVPDSFF